MSKKKECSRCKNIKRIDQFTSDTGRELVMCKRCRELQKAKRGEYNICRRENCTTQPSFGKEGSSKKEYCKAHSPPGYVDVAHKQCLYENCTIRPTYGAMESRKVEYCRTHSPSGYVDVTSKQCLHENCTKQPHYGISGCRKSEYCKSHAPAGYFIVTNKQCLHENCTKQPIYGIRGSKKKEYCKSHAPLGYTDVVNKHCLHENCTKQPHYGIPGSLKVEYCKSHAPSGYTDVISKQCLHENCTIRPNYGTLRSRKREYCKAHSPSGYTYVANKQCLHENCITHPRYGITGNRNVEYCKSHAPLGYTDIVSKQCLHENCTTRPTYGIVGSKKREYCKSHAPPGYTDVVNKRCLHENCTTRAGYNKPGYSPDFCVKHKTINMVIYPLKYGKDDMKECTYCLAEIHYSDDYCPSCKQFNILGQTVKTHAKELEIKVLLEANFDSDIFNHDKTVAGGCSRKRPDFLLTADWGNIVLEVDEFQHKRKTYPCECEITRMKEIYFDCGVKNLLFIRYNPDIYKTVTGEIPMTKKKRQDLLVKIIREQLKKKKVKNLGVMYLFYDHFSADAIEIDPIKPYK